MEQSALELAAYPLESSVPEPLKKQLKKAAKQKPALQAPAERDGLKAVPYSIAAIVFENPQPGPRR